jgi:hypothetical protein
MPDFLTTMMTAVAAEDLLSFFEVLPLVSHVRLLSTQNNSHHQNILMLTLNQKGFRLQCRTEGPDEIRMDRLEVWETRVREREIRGRE